MNNDEYPINKFISPDDEVLIAFCRTINPLHSPVSIPCVPHNYPLGLCYWNAHDYTQKHGGEVVYGWLLSVWPGRYIDAMHHAVVRSSDGKLMDVTPQMSGYDHPDRSVFLEDNSIKIDLHKKPNIHNRNYLLENCPITREMLHISDEIVSLNQQLTHITYKLGYREEVCFNDSHGIPVSSTTNILLNVISQRTEVQNLFIALNDKYEKLGELIRRLKSL